MARAITLAGMLALLFVATSAVAAQEAGPTWFIRAGVTQLTLADEIDLAVAGNPVPGTAIDTQPHYTPTIQIGRALTPNLTVSLTAGLPPHIDIDGAGSLGPYGRLAETTYGPTTLTLQYRPVMTGTLRPYVGAGAAYMIVFSAKDGAFQNVEIGNDLSPALEVGTDIMFAVRYGLFVEAKKAFLRPEARGTFGGTPIIGDVRLDPWAVSVGSVLRF